ncbi:MAG: PEGA domain-containing protein [Thermotogaceae bacterium]|nr:PEGA domain-containing protein [Thermotogaceae bacterium]
MKALIEGAECSGEGVDKLKKGIDDYLGDKIEFEPLVEYVIKIYSSSINCGVETTEKPLVKKEAYTPQGTAFLKLIPANDLVKGAKVYIDGTYAGKIEGEIFIKEITAGSHKVLVTSEKMEDMKFEIEAGEYEECEKEIEAKPATRVVKLTSDPPGATVYVNGKEEGETPKFVKLKVGKTYEIIMQKEGYKKLEKTFYIPEKGDVIEKSYELEVIHTILKVDSDPEAAKVYLSGRYLGKTPLIYKVDKVGISGELLIQKENYDIYNMWIEVSAGKQKEIKVQLKPYTILRIDSEPKGAEVYMGGNRVGNTPVELKVYQGETYGITLKKEGYNELKATLYIPEQEKEIEKFYTLEMKPTVLKVESEPEGAEVYFNGKYMGKTPIVLKGLRKSIGGTLVVTKEGYLGKEVAIYVSAGKERTVEVSLKKYELKWKFRTGISIESSPAIGKDGTIYVGSGSSNYYYLYAINPDGTLKWKFRTGWFVDSSPAIGKDGTIYVGSHDNYLYAINPDGTLKWKFKTGGNIFSSPAIGKDGMIYIGSNDCYLYAINPDGRLKWKGKTGGSILSSPAIGKDGTIYVGSHDNYLYAINPNGTLRWKFKTGHISSSPAIDQDGILYIGSHDKYLYAIITNSKGLADSSWPMFRRDARHTGSLDERSTLSTNISKESTYNYEGGKNEYNSIVFYIIVFTPIVISLLVFLQELF